MTPKTKDPLNPMENTFLHTPIPRISTQQIPIAGIPVTVYGVTELSPTAREAVVLWLLHPRLERSETMAPLAALAIAAWNERGQTDSTYIQKGLIAVSFDLRNHGHRQISAVANEVWRTGNPNHAKDLCAICEGTASDVSLLIDYLPPFVFPRGDITITQHICCGVSLGGHITWQLLAREARIKANIVVLGCADLVGMLQERARLSKIPDYVNATPPGKGFLGSPSFPRTLTKLVKRFNAAQIIMGSAYETGSDGPSESERRRLRSLYSQKLQGKEILIISGGADRMAPYSQSLPVIHFLLRALDPESGWWRDGEMTIKTVLVPTVRHELTMSMVNDVLAFILVYGATSSDPSAGAPPKL